jgi:hypothetical protein
MKCHECTGTGTYVPVHNRVHSKLVKNFLKKKVICNKWPNLTIYYELYRTEKPVKSKIELYSTGTTYKLLSLRGPVLHFLRSLCDSMIEI